MFDRVVPGRVPVLGAHQGRSARTCARKCGSACCHEAPNNSDNAYFADVVERTSTRRVLLKGAVSAIVLAGAPGVLEQRPANAAAAPASERARAAVGASGTGLSFRPISPTDRTYDDVVVPDGYAWDLLIRWGDPVEDAAPEWDVAAQTAAAQARQFGFNCDYVGFFPTGPGNGVAASSAGCWR